MEITVALPDKGPMATYLVEQEDNITYNVRLKAFTGHYKPPLYIKLYKTELGWTSAFESAGLIEKLGSAIEQQQSFAI